MKIVDVSAVTNTNAMPIKSGTLQFMQDAHKEAIAGLVTNVIPSPLTNTIYILSGCKNSTVAPIHTLSAGVLFYNGEIFNFDGATFTLTGLQKAYARIDTIESIATQFTDGITRNVGKYRKIVIENTTVSSGLPEFIDFINVGQWKDVTDVLNSAIVLLQAKDILLQNQITVLSASLPKNVGTVSGLNIGESTVGATKAVSGDVVSCTVQGASGSSTTYRVVIANAMSGSNYYVRSFVQGMSTSLYTDNAIGSVVFKQINTTTFDFNIQEFDTQAQNLKIYFEVI